MNQHITKLVRQALKESVSTPVESVVASRIDDHGIVEIPNTFAEKFAELIIKESITEMEKHDYHATWLGEKLKEHFGVKE